MPIEDDDDEQDFDETTDLSGLEIPPEVQAEIIQNLDEAFSKELTELLRILKKKQ